MSSTMKPTQAKAVVQETSRRSLRRRNDAPTPTTVAEPKSKKLPAAPAAAQAAQPTDATNDDVVSVGLRSILDTLFVVPATAVVARAEPTVAAPAAVAVAEPAVAKPRGKRPRRETQLFQSPDFNAKKKAFGDLRKKN